MIPFSVMLRTSGSARSESNSVWLNVPAKPLRSDASQSACVTAAAIDGFSSKWSAFETPGRKVTMNELGFVDPAKLSTWSIAPKDADARETAITTAESTERMVVQDLEVEQLESFVQHPSNAFYSAYCQGR